MRFYGLIGFATTNTDNDDDIWKEEIIAKPYMGDVIRHGWNAQPAEKLTKDIKLNAQISIIADEFAYDFMHLIRYAVYRNAKWEVTAIDIQRPRLILTLGGVYNG